MIPLTGMKTQPICLEGGLISGFIVSHRHKDPSGKQQSLSCLDSQQCQKKISALDLNYSFGQLIALHHSR